MITRQTCYTVEGSSELFPTFKKAQDHAIANLDRALAVRMLALGFTRSDVVKLVTSLHDDPVGRKLIAHRLQYPQTEEDLNEDA